MDSNLLMLLLLSGGSLGGSPGGSRTEAIIKRTIPVLMPGPLGAKMAVAFLVAKKDLELQEKADKEKENADKEKENADNNAHKEAIKGVVKLAQIKDEAELLAKLPALHDLFETLPDPDKAEIFPPTPSPPLLKKDKP